MDIVNKLREYAAAQQAREDNAKPRTAEIIQTAKEVWAAERQRLREIEEAAHVAYEYLNVIRRSGQASLSMALLDSIIGRLGQALMLSKPSEEPAEERVSTGELALIQEAMDITGDETVYE